MAIRVHIPTPMRQHTDGQAVVEASGGTVKAVLDDLGQRFPGVSQRLFDNGQVRRFVNVYLNDEDVRFVDGINTKLADGDTVTILPAVAGGMA